MGFLRIADTTSTKRIEHESGDYIEVRANLSKRELNSILSALPLDIANEKMTFASSIGASEALFSALVVGWSLPVPADLENYLSLEGEAATWIDTSIMEHFSSLQMTKDESGNASNSAKGSRKGTA